jgi:hypothetical protein
MKYLKGQKVIEKAAITKIIRKYCKNQKRHA